MALVVEDGSGKPDAESFCSVAEADTYVTTMRGDPTAYADSWTGLTTPVKESLLRWATRLIGRLWSFDGTKTTTTQALPWPRDGVEDEEGTLIDNDVIPNNLKYAEIELALALSSDPDRVDDPEIGLSSLTSGTVQLVFDKLDRAGVLTHQVKDYLADYGSPTSGGSGRREVWRA